MIIILLLGSAFSQENFTFPYNCYTDGTFCSYYWIGDGICDPNCMSPPCNYDSYDQSSLKFSERVFSSDCLSECTKKGCNMTELRNGVCENTNCNYQECG